ncbi:hypothetical protein PMIN01_12139 [Paraphaeosphaeria minitans]|uniref:Uncharacterized protein n=1 Tax=Paraphaeosphaeria minitans TaxID=565426 RepID=A0A9P6G6U7_9PLEO|nr:hypothetical protein PMIN01_12139 [Paraphaeosphaeria minitans]
MEARLAARRFYMARAPTSSHKSTLPSPAYPSASMVCFLLTPLSPLLVARTHS